MSNVYTSEDLKWDPWKNKMSHFISSRVYTIEDLKRHVFNLQMSGIGNDLPLRCTKHPYGVRF